MKEGKVYLKDSTIAEPLFNRWYAWSYLISPATAAMYVANFHLKIMRSFVTSPQVHVAAMKNPAMLGGPFICYPESKVPEISELITATVQTQARLIELAESIKALDAMLLAEAGGHSLERLYPKVPPLLKGYVELVYDHNNHPSFRFIEGLLYRSPFYDPSWQSIALSAMGAGARPFVFTSPKLPTDHSLCLQVPFSSGALDQLFKLRRTPGSLNAVADLLKIAPADRELFSSFFTTEAPRPHQAYTGKQVRIRYFGHACVLIESKGLCILTDPVINHHRRHGIDCFTLNDLPEQIDYLLITHNHQDHCMFETLLQIRHQVKEVVIPRSNGGTLMDPSLKLALQKIGFTRVTEIDEMEEIEVAGGSIIGLPFLGEHGDVNIRSKVAYLVTLRGRSIFFAADSNNIAPELYQHISRITGEVEVVFIGMECDGAPMSWVYGPLLTRPLARKMDQERRFDGSDCAKAVRLVECLRPKQAYVYAMGQEPWLTHLTSIQYTDQSRPIIESNNFCEYCRRHGIESERLFGQKEIVL